MVINCSVAEYTLEVRVAIGERNDVNQECTYKFMAEPSGKTYYLKAICAKGDYIPIKAYREAIKHLFEFNQAPASQVCVIFSKENKIFVRNKEEIDETLMGILVRPSTVYIYS